MASFTGQLVDKTTRQPTGEYKTLRLSGSEAEAATYGPNGVIGGYHNTVTDQNDSERYMVYGVECEKGNGCFCQWHIRPVGRNDVP